MQKACKIESIACDDCDKWIHRNCIGMSTSECSNLLVGKSEDTLTCPSCCKPNNSSTKIYFIPNGNDSKHSIQKYIDQSINDMACKPLKPKPVRRNICLWKKAEINNIKEDLQNFITTFKNIKDRTVESLWQAFKTSVQTTVEKKSTNKNDPRKKHSSMDLYNH
ncbi:unnamed protein product [Mytilus edulis]|uniref:Zinc finger PHD-type domain-containing protein n=1 Tax=Mytilus edulis TaxID=6550 RepID=A0A8S3U1W0_MYTED|nr:unnamed protein product [Mytilus edulis]